MMDYGRLHGQEGNVMHFYYFAFSLKTKALIYGDSIQGRIDSETACMPLCGSILTGVLP